MFEPATLVGIVDLWKGRGAGNSPKIVLLLPQTSILIPTFTECEDLGPERIPSGLSASFAEVAGRAK